MLKPWMPRRGGGGAGGRCLFLLPPYAIAGQRRDITYISTARPPATRLLIGPFTPWSSPTWAVEYSVNRRGQEHPSAVQLGSGSGPLAMTSCRRHAYHGPGLHFRLFNTTLRYVVIFTIRITHMEPTPVAFCSGDRLLLLSVYLPLTTSSVLIIYTATLAPGM